MATPVATEVPRWVWVLLIALFVVTGWLVLEMFDIIGVVLRRRGSSREARDARPATCLRWPCFVGRLDAVGSDGPVMVEPSTGGDRGVGCRAAAGRTIQPPQAVWKAAGR